MRIEKLGLQMYTIRSAPMRNADEVRAVFRRIRQLGYEMIHTADCPIPPAEFGRVAAEEGIVICGTHDDFDRMVREPEYAMEMHRQLGTTNIGCGGFIPESPEEVEQFIEDANGLADKVYDYGFKVTYHHHSYEFERFPDGRTAMEMLVDGLDPVKTSIVLDTYWVQYAGGDVRYWIEKLAGRIDILHLKGMGWNKKGPFITEIGSDNMNWAGILETADKAGVKYYVVEQDIWPGNPFDSIKQSSEYLHKYFM